jgi:FKBP-type peptidyl-prolyl cis-trans isomerase FkpA
MKIRPLHVVAAVIGVWVLVWAFFEMFPPKENKGGPGAPGTPVTTTAPAADFPLKKEDVKVGTGAEATPGKTVVVHYSGKLTDGTEFDSDSKHGEPYSFTLGARQVIEGWDEGVKGMKEGGKRKLTVPPSMGYGEQGRSPTIPPNAILIFDIELLKVK